VAKLRPTKKRSTSLSKTLFVTPIIIDGIATGIDLRDTGRVQNVESRAWVLVIESSLGELVSETTLPKIE
jgi:hypothetical protein